MRARVSTEALVSSRSLSISVLLVLDEPLGVSVHLLALSLDLLSTLLTGGDSVVDSLLQLLLVSILESSELLATLAGLLSLLADDTGQVLDLSISLLVVLSDNLAEVSDLLAEGSLSLADSVHGIEAHAAGSSFHLSVLLSLLFLVGLELGPHSGGGLLEAVLSVLAVSSELLADGSEGSVEGLSHLVELVVILEVLGVALVTELDHAGHLSVHVSVHLSL